MTWLDSILRGRSVDAKNRPAGEWPVYEALEARQFLSASPAPARPPSTNPGGPAATAPPAVGVVGETLRAQAGRPASGDVGVLTGASGVASDFRNLHASIDWGDGTDPADGSFSRDSRGRIHVHGTHTYDDAGTYAVTVAVSKGPIVPPGQPSPFFQIHLATIHSRAVVSAGTGVNLIEVATQKFTATLGSFTFRNIDLRLRATIAWGDGKQSIGEVVRTSLAGYEVIGTHTYARTGIYKVQVKVTGSPFGGPTLPGTSPLASFQSTIDVKGFA